MSVSVPICVTAHTEFAHAAPVATLMVLLRGP